MLEMKTPGIVVKYLGIQDYTVCMRNMQEFTQQRTEDTADELWFVEHPPVYTLGLNGKQEHILNAGNIPVVQSDRGGQVTYHGPGQIVVYLLLNIRRRHLGVRELVTRMESAVIDLLGEYSVQSTSRRDAPGVYVKGSKIAALGLRVKKGYTYHGLSLNVTMDLEPFNHINPCGYENLPVTQLSDLVANIRLEQIRDGLLQHLERHLK